MGAWVPLRTGQQCPEGTENMKKMFGGLAGSPSDMVVSAHTEMGPS